MEYFPLPEPHEAEQPDQNNTVKKYLKDISKAALVGAVIASVNTAEAQNHTAHIDINNSTTVSMEETPTIQLENQKMILTLSNLEGRIKELSQKTAHHDHLTYAVITESDALRQTNFYTNKLEVAVTQDAEDVIINNQHRTYQVATRTPGSIDALLKEREMMMGFGAKNAKHVLDTYLPVDIYVTVGATQHTDSTLTATIRFVNLKTKEVSMYSVEHSLKRKIIPEDGYNALSNAVQQKIMEVVNQ